MSAAYDLYQEGRSRLRRGMNAQATVPLERAARLEPDKASIREALGIAYFRIRQLDAAEVQFRALLELAPSDPYAHYALGRTLEALGQTDESRRHYKLARSLDPASERYARHAAGR